MPGLSYQRGKKKKIISSFYYEKGNNFICSFSAWETDSHRRGPTTFMLTHTGKTARPENQHAALLSKSPLPIISETADPRRVREVLFQ